MTEREKIIELIGNTIFQADMEDDGEDIGASVLTALEAAGYVVVPREPTLAMVKTGTDARWRSAIRDADNVREIYAAMLATFQKETH